MKFILHGHHDCLISVLPSLEDRILEIKQAKPSTEHAIRLRLIRELTEDEIGRLPEAIREAADACHEAAAALYKADAAWDNVGLCKTNVEWRNDKSAFDNAKAALRKADTMFIKAVADNTPLIDAWHKSVCVSDCSWDGETILKSEEL